MFIFCIYFLRSVRVPSPNAFFLLFDTLNIKKDVYLTILNINNEKERLFDGFFPLKPSFPPQKTIFHEFDD